MRDVSTEENTTAESIEDRIGKEIHKTVELLNALFWDAAKEGLQVDTSIKKWDDIMDGLRVLNVNVARPVGRG